MRESLITSTARKILRVSATSAGATGRACDAWPEAIGGVFLIDHAETYFGWPGDGGLDGEWSGTLQSPSVVHGRA